MFVSVSQWVMVGEGEDAEVRGQVLGPVTIEFYSSLHKPCNSKPKNNYNYTAMVDSRSGHLPLKWDLKA